MQALRAAVQLAEETIESLKHIPAAVAALRQQFDTLLSERRATHSAALSQLQLACSSSITERDTLLRLREKAVREAARASERLEHAESTQSRLETKTSELKRLQEEVTARKATMRKVELLRNTQLIWSRRVLMKLQRTMAVWRCGEEPGRGGGLSTS